MQSNAADQLEQRNISLSPMSFGVASLKKLYCWYYNLDNILLAY